MEPLLEIKQPSKLKALARKPSVIAAVFLALGLLIMWTVMKDEPPVEQKEVVAQAPTTGYFPEVLPPLLLPNALPPPAKVSPTPSSAWNRLPAPPPRPSSSPAPSSPPASPEAPPAVASKPFTPHPYYQPPARDANDWVEKTLRGEED